MNDRELLELAARAAGINIIWEEPEEGDGWCFIPNQPPDKRRRRDDHYDGVVWNPLTDPGDALRLAVRLHLHTKQFPITDDGFSAQIGTVEVWRCDDEDPLHVEILHTGDDRLAATMRAITRAAAGVGKAKT